MGNELHLVGMGEIIKIEKCGSKEKTIKLPNLASHE